MGRLTKRYGDEIGCQRYSCYECCVACNTLDKMLEKLAHYEDMEEQGLLTIIDNETFQRDDLDRCTHRHCNKCDKYRRELQQYKDLEEQGRLIEQKHGTWLPNRRMIRTPTAENYHCSECTQTGKTTAYCPNCGAKMELKELEGDHFTDVDKMGKE